jgi:glycerol-3-phosphate cytidylyltransferase
MSQGKIVYTGGSFDLFHVGHVDLLQQCRWLSGPDGRVVVALNTDDFIVRYKGSKPIMSYSEREAVLLSSRYVDEVIPNENGEDSKPAILSINPDFLIVGSDWARKDYYKQMDFDQDWLDQHGITLVYFPRTRNLSTTAVKQRK